MKSSFSDFKQVKAIGGRSSVGLSSESWIERGVRLFWMKVMMECLSLFAITCSGAEG